MNNKSSAVVKDFSDYLDWIDQCYEEMQSHHRPLFFRGHADLRWELIPSIYRKPYHKERDVILDYKQVLYPESDYLYNIEKILVRMQHHQVPTRLLDWSISPLTALYFACSGDMDSDAKVYMFNPWNDVFKGGKDGKPTYYFEILKSARFLLALGWSFEEIKNYIQNKFNYSISSIELELPLPIVGRYMDDRVSSQLGCFTIWGSQKISLDMFSEYIAGLKSIIIPNDCKEGLMNKLSKLGITDFTIFRDIEGFAKEIKKNGSIYRL
ncbi:MAG: FRG domain-containing protein [Muribaculaceae bacterium]|nr:FRG domain-containing protein [Muribaculaceae bacterium]